MGDVPRGAANLFGGSLKMKPLSGKLIVLLEVQIRAKVVLHVWVKLTRKFAYVSWFSDGGKREGALGFDKKR